MQGDETAPFPDATLRARRTHEQRFLVDATEGRVTLTLSYFPLRDQAQDFPVSGVLRGPDGGGDEEGVRMPAAGGSFTLEWCCADRTAGDPPLEFTVRAHSSVAANLTGWWYWGSKAAGRTDSGRLPEPTP